MKAKTATKAPTVFLIDDDKAVRDAVGALAKAGGYRFAGFSTPQEFLAAGADDAIGCLLLDVQDAGALDFQEKLAEQRIAIPVIIVSAHADVPTVVRAVRQGAFDVIEKPFKDDHLAERIDEAVKQHKKIRKWEVDRNEVAEREARLTPRERQVYDLMSEGVSNKNIAAELEISHKTLDIHRANVMRKMKAKTAGELVRMSYLSKSKPGDRR